MNAEDVARYDQLKTSNDAAEQRIMAMGLRPDPSKEVILRQCAMLETILRHFDIVEESDLRFEELRADEMAILEPAAEQMVADSQQRAEDMARDAAHRRLGVR